MTNESVAYMYYNKYNTARSAYSACKFVSMVFKVLSLMMKY